jgi:hypothetical protein
VCQKHETIQQTHRIIYKIYEVLVNKIYCTAAFIDISQTFDKVRHMGLLLKLKQALPHPKYTLLRSYLTHRTYQVWYQEAHTKLHPIQAGIPPDSILGPIFYNLHNLRSRPTRDELMLTATYAGDTAILASHEDSTTATSKLQTHLTFWHHNLAFKF